MKNHPSRIILALVLLLALCGGVIYQHIHINQKNSFDLKEYERTLQELEELQKDREDLDFDYQYARKELEQIWYELLDADENNDTKIIEEVNTVQKYAGLTDVSGSGIVLSLNDKENYDPAQDHVASIIHDKNLVYLLDLLVDYGAQALSVNDLRIVNSSEIFCVGTTILCNNQRMTPPYIIKAIGPAEELRLAVERDPLYTQLTAPPYNIRLDIKSEPRILIKSYETPATIEQDISLLKNVP